MDAFEVVYLERSPGETRVALFHLGRMQEFHVFRACRPRVGDIVLGRTLAKAIGGDAVFVAIEGSQPGFLPLEDTPSRRLPPLGEAVLTQVTQEPRGKKGAKLTGRIAFAGRCLVYTPFTSGVACSTRLTRKTERERLLTWAKEATTEEEGVIIRTQAFDVPKSILLGELTHLRQEWRSVRDRLSTCTPPCRLSTQELPLAAALAGRDALRIVCSDLRAVQEAKAARPDLDQTVALWKESARMFAVEGVDEALDEALASRLSLSEGATLVIEETAALTAIDVDSGPLSPEQANLLACPEIVRHIRLRALAGAILIDFASPRKGAWEAKKALQHRLEQAFADDPVPTRVLGLTSLGLVEIQRDRRRPPLSDLFLSGPASRVVSPEAEALDALRRILSLDGATPGPTARLDVSLSAGALLRGSLQPALREAEQTLGKTLTIADGAKRATP